MNDYNMRYIHTITASVTAALVKSKLTTIKLTTLQLASGNRITSAGHQPTTDEINGSMIMNEHGMHINVTLSKAHIAIAN